MARSPGPVVREVLSEGGWSVVHRHAWHPLWGRVDWIDAVVLSACHHEALAVLSTRRLVHGGGQARC